MDLPSDLRTPKQLARVLGVHVTTVRRWIREGRLPGFRIGGRARASEAAARALITPIEPRRKGA